MRKMAEASSSHSTGAASRSIPALLRELVGETVAAENSVDGFAELVSADLDIEPQMIVVEELVILAADGLTDTPPAELDRIEYVQGTWWSVKELELGAFTQSPDLRPQRSPKGALVAARRSATILTRYGIARTERAILDAGANERQNPAPRTVADLLLLARKLAFVLSR